MGNYRLRVIIYFCCQVAEPETSEEKWPRLLKQVEAMRKLQTGLLATVRKIEDPAVQNILFGEACRELDDILKSNSKTATKSLVKEDEASDSKKDGGEKERIKLEATLVMKTAPGAKMKMVNTNTRGLKLRPSDQRSISSYFMKGEDKRLNLTLVNPRYSLRLC